MYNKVVILGNVASEPTIKTLPSGEKVANFTLATNRRYKDEKGQVQEAVEYHDCVAWDGYANTIEKHVHKSDLIFVEGELRNHKWESNGITHVRTNIRVFEIRFANMRSRNKREEPAAETKQD